ncbi:hypothetical protein L1279_003566 [Planomicrobium sp. HSC-17F08]|nr:hypothetical protein [Planomicrobium sp. HSC-17F08]
MTVNHGGRLQPDYFRSYLFLVMNSRQCTVECARDFVLTTFFQGNPEMFGPESYESFQIAVKSLSKEG